MRIVSIDVGIINLAICRVDVDLDKGPTSVNILDWLLICLNRDDFSENQRCQGRMKSGRVCGSKCKWISVKGNETVFSCKKHIPEDVDILLKNARKLQDMEEELHRCLNRYPQLLDADLVLIENQPSMLNPMLKTVQIMLHSYFLQKGIQNTKSRMKHIQCVHASLKMKMCPKELKSGGETGKTKKKRKAYEKRKKLAEQGTLNLLKTIERGDEHLKFFEAQKKKNDLADCLLQAAAYVFC